MQKYFLGAVLLFALGCGGGGAGSGEQPVVALIMKSLANEFFVSMADGARAHHTEHDDDYDLIVNGIRNENDIAQQVALVEQMIARDVAAIVLAPADSRALIPVAQRAQEAGIVVVNIDNKFDEATLAQAGVQIPFVGPDNRAGARLVGERLTQELVPGSQVAIIGGTPTAFNAQQRQAGFEDAMRAAGMNVVTSQSGYWEQEPANTVAAAMLREHPNLAAILCANDNMALGAAAAVRQAGKQNDVLVVGFDNIDAVHPLLRAGRLLATADQHPDQLAVFGIELALEMVRGEATGEDRNTPVDLVTVETLEEDANSPPPVPDGAPDSRAELDTAETTPPAAAR